MEGGPRAAVRSAAMRAIRLHEFGPAENLVYEEVEDPQPATGQVRIAVAAAGVHLIDTNIRAGVQQGPMPLPELPTVPGREVAGTVDALGAGVDESWLGRRVVAHLGPASGGHAELAVPQGGPGPPPPDRGAGRTSAGAVPLRVVVGPADAAVGHRPLRPRTDRVGGDRAADPQPPRRHARARGAGPRRARRGPPRPARAALRARRCRGGPHGPGDSRDRRQGRPRALTPMAVRSAAVPARPCRRRIGCRWRA